MFHKSIKYLIPLCIGIVSQANAQEVVTETEITENVINREDYGVRTYKLGDITVTGNVKYNELTILTFTGLEKGQEINIPGEEIPDAIKKLWKLNYFSDINFYETSIVGDVINLELNLNELPRLNEITLNGLKKAKKAEILKDLDIKKGTVINDNLITNTTNYIQNKYKKDGFFNSKVDIKTVNSADGKTQDMIIDFDKGKKVKIESINIEGNSKLTNAQIKKAMKETKTRSVLNPKRIFKSSKYIEKNYKTDLNSIIDKYKENGYRDAQIVEETATYNPKTNRVKIDLKIEEGNQYHIGNIRFVGNTIYPDRHLRNVLGIKNGDLYNGVLLQKKIADASNPDAFDLTNEYHNHGYLFAQVIPVETKTYNDTIDYDIRIVEGPLARYNNITVSGNNKTHDNIIYRELSTRPGQIWSKADVVESIRRLGGMGIFDAESITPDIKPDAYEGKVDINWDVTENGQSQVEVQGGYGGGALIGTLALSFNNFSARNLFNKDAYKPFPMGDAQKMSLRIQASTYYRTFSLSFSEPWFRGRKPISLFGSVSHSKQFAYNFSNYKVDRSQGLNITSVNFGFAKRLSVPDDFFTVSHSLGFQYYDLNNYDYGLFNFKNGSSKNLSYNFNLTRDSRGNNPIFPKYGSLLSFDAKLTPPYSLFNKVDYANLGNEKEYKIRTTQIQTNPQTGADIPIGTYLDSKGMPVANWEDAAPNEEKIDQKRFNWLEYYKINLKAEWYSNLFADLVLKTSGQFGFLGAYNQGRGLIPFERYYLGGSGMINYSMDGRENIALRGYPDNSLSPVNASGVDIGGTVYNKFALELRYPITLKQSMSAYVLGFFDAGASYASFKNYNPFKLQRGAGAGVRVHMPMFGLLGIDFGYGFDNIPGTNQKGGWQTHFVLGQQF